MTEDEIGTFCNALYVRTFLQLNGYYDSGSTSGADSEITIKIDSTETEGTVSSSQEEEPKP